MIQQQKCGVEKRFTEFMIEIEAEFGIGCPGNFTEGIKIQGKINSPFFRSGEQIIQPFQGVFVQGGIRGVELPVKMVEAQQVAALCRQLIQHEIHQSVRGKHGRKADIGSPEARRYTRPAFKFKIFAGSP
ncbi:hypothetical protein SDC9_103353 [bioreactor metagenome]|uniref:Uncharacterized protein n=1 Tax=bioreactor metagenome TaxID=1076179 RepID=A0A645ATY1_9ZZZZ